MRSGRFCGAGSKGFGVSALLVAALAAGAVGAETPASAVVPGANGKIAFTSGRDGDQEIYVMNADGTGQTNLTNNPAFDILPAWSPDATKIAYTSDRDETFNLDIYVMDADGTGQTNLTNSPAVDIFPAWSPDGTKIAFMTWGRGGDYEIYVMNADGAGQTNLTNSPDLDGEPVWSPDGTKIAFISQRDGTAEIYVMNADGTGQTRLTSDPTSSPQNPAWSPDGTKIAFALIGGVEDDAEIYVMNADGTGRTNLTNNPAADDVEPDWGVAGVGADLSVAITDAPDPVKHGDTVTYTTTVANAGPDGATGVRVTDTAPAKDAKVVSATASQGTCTLAKATATCNLDTLAAGQSATVTVVVKAQKKGTLVDTANVTGDQTDPNSLNNTDTETTTVS